MKHFVLLTVLLCSPSWAYAQTTKVTPLMTKELTGIPGKEGTMLTVEYSPGESSPIHRHNAHVFVYVLEGTVIMQVKGGDEVRLTPGQTVATATETVGGVHLDPAKEKQPYDYQVLVALQLTRAELDYNRRTSHYQP